MLWWRSGVLPPCSRDPAAPRSRVVAEPFSPRGSIPLRRRAKSSVPRREIGAQRRAHEFLSDSASPCSIRRWRDLGGRGGRRCIRPSTGGLPVRCISLQAGRRRIGRWFWLLLELGVVSAPRVARHAEPADSRNRWDRAGRRAVHDGSALFRFTDGDPNQSPVLDGRFRWSGGISLGVTSASGPQAPRGRSGDRWRGRRGHPPRRRRRRLFRGTVPRRGPEPVPVPARRRTTALSRSGIALSAGTARTDRPRWSIPARSRGPIQPGTARAGRPVIYEMHIGTFTREGTGRRPPRAARACGKLGITTLEIMPIADFAGQHSVGLRRREFVCPHAALRRPTTSGASSTRAHALASA